MKKVEVEYEDGVLGKGHIVMMVTRRKSELSKTRMKRLWTTHGGKILAKRTKGDIVEEEYRKLNERRCLK